MTIRETILAALHARLSALPATALRGEVLSERLPAEGLLLPRAWTSHGMQTGRWTACRG